MLNQDWEKFGDDIRRTVQDAIDSQDFNRLNQTITNTVNNAMDGLGKGLHNVGRSFGDAYKHERTEKREYQRFNQEYEQEAAQQQGAQNHAQQDQHILNQYRAVQGKNSLSKNNTLFASTTGVKVGGVVLTTVGSVLSGGMLICLGILAAAVVLSPPQPLDAILGILGVVAALLFAGGGVMLVFGTRFLGKVKRFRAYSQALEGKEYCEIKELSGTAKKSEKYIVKDIKRFIEKGWFRQGHLDNQCTCLIASNQAFEQYTKLMNHMEQQRQEAARAKEQQAVREGNLDPQIQEILRTGDEYIQKIHGCNDRIPGQEISAKISKMETLIDRIFDRVEQNQDNIPDVRRLMEYYLPTTVKLLEAYEELDQQPIQGENIISSKLEIEKTLDTLNAAFEKLLDSMFQDTAWNVSADISVLKTMLAQEGLTPDDFK